MDRNALVKQASESIEGMEKLASSYESFYKSANKFIDGVAKFCKEADLSRDEAAAVWGCVGDAVEKSAADVPGAGAGFLDKAKGYLQSKAPTAMNSARDIFHGWKQNPMGSLGQALIPAGVGALGGLLYSGAQSAAGEKDVPWMRNMLLPALMGGAFGPAAMQYGHNKGWWNKPGVPATPATDAQITDPAAEPPAADNETDARSNMLERAGIMPGLSQTIAGSNQ